MSAAYYNEIDSYAAQSLRNLIAAGYIAPGDVDERSIEDVRPDDLRGYTQCHFFAGIGVWSYALRLAGWPDDRRVWTGSCPCQPFSAAGKGRGFADERHLWPAWFHLITQCRPDRIYGEQVASKDGLAWLDVVQADLEAAGHAVGAVDLCAAGVGAPHIRQRLFFVGDADDRGGRRDAGTVLGAQGGARRGVRGVAHGVEPASATCELADSSSTGLEGRDARTLGHERAALERGGGAGALADDDGCEGLAGARVRRPAVHDADGCSATGRVVEPRGERRVGREGPLQGGDAHRTHAGWKQSHDGFVGVDQARSFWSDADWIPCRDGKWRPVEPGTFPLAHGAPSRVGRLRAYGNAIVAQAAAAFIGATM